MKLEMRGLEMVRINHLLGHYETHDYYVKNLFFFYIGCPNNYCKGVCMYYSREKIK